MKHSAYSNAHGTASLRQVADLVSYKLRGPEQIARVKAAAFARMKAAVVAELGTLRGQRVVDFGSGQWMSNAKLFAAAGARVLAVDPELPPARASGYLRLLRDAGVQRTAKTLAAATLLRRRFDDTLEAETGLAAGKARYQRFAGSGAALPLASGTVDAVVSDNVFEHLPDVAAAADEIVRVLRPGGVVCLTIHPFTALSGGHHPETIRHAGDLRPSRVPPWDHLLDRRFPSGVYLNGVRNRDYRTILTSRFETVAWDEGLEGVDVLTDDILDRLPGYTREELLVGKIFFVGRSRGGA